ncbi:DUF4259 domain-containing protein [Streptomyces sp. NPDC001889]
MGTWGSGNFDSDTAADHLSGLTGGLIAEITEFMAGDPVELEADEYGGTVVPCNLELLGLIARQGYVGALLPEAGVVEEWRERYMRAWEGSIDDLEPVAGHKEARRERLTQVFDTVARAARERDEAVAAG